VTQEAPRSGPRKRQMIPLPDYTPKMQGEIFLCTRTNRSWLFCAYEQVYILNLLTSPDAASPYASVSNPLLMLLTTSLPTEALGSLRASQRDQEPQQSSVCSPRTGVGVETLAVEHLCLLDVADATVVAGVGVTGVVAALAHPAAVQHVAAFLPQVVHLVVHVEEADAALQPACGRGSICHPEGTKWRGVISIEWFGLEVTLKITWFQPPCHEQGHLPPDQVPRGQNHRGPPSIFQKPPQTQLSPIPQRPSSRRLPARGGTRGRSARGRRRGTQGSGPSPSLTQPSGPPALLRRTGPCPG